MLRACLFYTLIIATASSFQDLHCDEIRIFECCLRVLHFIVKSDVENARRSSAVIT
jgi:hypothetical protein